MTLGEIKIIMVKLLGEYTDDAGEPNVIALYMPEGLAYINEAYVVAMKRYAPKEYVELLKDDADEPLFEPAAFHAILADYAAARILMAEPGKTEKAVRLMAQWESGLAQVERPRAFFHNRWN